MKNCKKCLKDLPLESFYSRKDSTDGKYSYCIHCTKENQKGYRKTEAYKVSHSGSIKKWQVNNKERHTKINRESSKKHSKLMTDSYMVKRIKGRTKSRLKAQDIKAYPLLMEAAKINLLLKRKLNQNN